VKALLDRTTGEPLIGTVETRVMQEPSQKTAATQPFPVGDAIVPQSLDMPLEGFERVNEGKIFTPFKEDKPRLWKPLAAVNWPPSSYDPATHTMFICAADSFWGAQGGDPDYPVEPGALYSGSIVARVSAPRRGVFAAPRLIGSSDGSNGRSSATAARSRPQAGSCSSAATTAGSRRSMRSTARGSGNSKPTAA
jgi:hypothetical protein